MQPLIHYLLGPLKRRLITPALTWAGDMLERIPERWRPPIRTRDRVAQQRDMEADPSARRGPLLSPIGLEPVVERSGARAQPHQPDGGLSSSHPWPGEEGAARVHPTASASRIAPAFAGSSESA